MGMRRLGVALAAACCLALPAAASAAPLEATIARDRYGVPHITARDEAGLGYGYGYALAQDNLCVMEDTYMTVRGQRARYLGPDAKWTFGGNGTTANNLNSDFFFQKIIDAGTVEKLLATPPPAGPEPQVRALVRGYVAGFNRRLAKLGGAAGVRDPACRGKPWVQPISEIDVWRHYFRLVVLASSGAAIDGIGSAQPPGAGARAAATSGASLPSRAALTRLGEAFGGLLGGGSNAVALGGNATASGRGMVLGNPHFPWDGSERLYQSHLRIPGTLDVSGASLLGVPLILIGATRSLAWSHTVSYAYRFTPFQLTLAPGDPTSYVVDGQTRKMTPRTVTVEALAKDGTLQKRTRTLYDTEYGPIFTSVVGQSLFPWTPGSAFALGDANALNFRVMNHFLAVDRAKSVRQVLRILKSVQGVPWVNTIAADSHGEALYADISVVPDVPDDLARRCNTAVGVTAYALLRLPVLDGSRSSCGWERDADAVQPGAMGPARQPSLLRRDYVINTNDSYWLANPQQRLEGYPRIMGGERSVRSLRGRMGLKLLGEATANGRKLTLADLQGLLFADRGLAAELWREPAARMCRELPVVPTTSGPVDVSKACPVLEKWDGRDTLDSPGAPLFRRFATRLLGVAVPGDPAQGTQPAGVFTTPFDPAEPIATPSGLNTANPAVRAALGDAVRDLQQAGIPLDAPLRGVQYEERGSERIPIHGGPGSLGVFNAINTPWVPKVGWPSVPHGSSFIMAAELTPGCPRLRTNLTYSQATDPTSPWYANGTRLYSAGKWASPPACAAALARARGLVVTRLRRR
jgi:acyl-homoserine-lactone acylase